MKNSSSTPKIKASSSTPKLKTSSTSPKPSPNTPKSKSSTSSPKTKTASDIHLTSWFSPFALKNVTLETVVTNCGIFQSLDTDKDGFISAHEFAEGLRKLGKQDLSDDAARVLIDKENLSKDGKLDFGQFLAASESELKDEIVKMRRFFQLYDKDKDGRLTLLEFGSMLKIFDPNMRDQQSKMIARELIGRVERVTDDLAEKDGLLNFFEFMMCMFV